MLDSSPAIACLNDLASSQRRTLLDFISMSSRAPDNPDEIIEILSASLTLKYISTRRN